MPAQSSMDFLTQTLAPAKKERTLSGIPLALVKNGVPAHFSYGFLVQQALAWGKEAVLESSTDLLANTPRPREKMYCVQNFVVPAPLASDLSPKPHPAFPSD